MSYMRGDCYLWVDGGNNLHIWVKNGYDEWDNSGWAATGEENEDGSSKVREEMKNASGVSIPRETMDEYVVMRMAELISEDKAEEIINRVIAPDGNCQNSGGVTLALNADKLKAALKRLVFESPVNPSR